MSRVSEWLVRVADLAEAEADALRLAVRREVKLAAAQLRRWSVGFALLTMGAVMLVGSALLLLGSVYTALEQLIGGAAAAAVAAAVALVLAGGCLWGFLLLTRP